MLVESWGVSDISGLALFNTSLGIFIFIVYLGITGILLFNHKQYLGKKLFHQWRWLIALSVAGWITSQLFPLTLPFSSHPLMIFAAVPLLLAASILNPIGVMIVGGMTGLGHAFNWFYLFNFAFAGWIAHYFLQQRYMGSGYRWLRHPIVAGGLSMITAAILIGVSEFGANSSIELSADHALFLSGTAFWLFLIEGVVGGGLLLVIFRGLPHLRPIGTLIPSPAQRSLRGRLLGNFLGFSFILSVLLITAVYNISISVSRRQILTQMTLNAMFVAAEIPEFNNDLQKLVEAFDESELETLGNGVDNQAHLEQIFKSSNLEYEQILLVDTDEEEIIDVYPPTTNKPNLSADEMDILPQVLESNESDSTTNDDGGDDQILSFIVPIPNTKVVLIGRIPQESLDKLVRGLQGTAVKGIGFIVDENNRYITHPNSKVFVKGDGKWERDVNGRTFSIASEGGSAGAYQTVNPKSNTRQLVYYLQEETQSWTVVQSVPYTAVLTDPLQIGAALLLLLLFVTGGSYALLNVQSREIAASIVDVAQASKTMAAGGEWRPAVHAQRDDEIGQLSQAFAQMQRSMKKRLNELSLLLGVSHDVSANIDIKQGMPAILRGALRGTGASGARAVVLNPSGGNPLTFGEGPAANEMAALDRRIMSKLRYESELSLNSSTKIREALSFGDNISIPVPTLLAIPLHSHDRFQGVLWIGYRQARKVDITERNLLRTLASQAAILVENARLFATAEGGRRRLAAVLASTSDAVIVTDPTKRILLINPAMEHIFGLKANDVANRSVTSVIHSEPLEKALTGNSDYTHNLEIPIEDGRTFYASISRIKSRAGQTYGRVAVLRDITHLKEIDEMKTDFVRLVSHDLRNPLTFMGGYVAMLPMVGDINEKQSEYIDKITNGIDQMAKMVDDLLDLGRIEAGVDVEQDEIALSPLMQDIAEEYWQHAHLSGIKIHVEVTPKESKIRGDQGLIRQAITNLLGNSIKYAKDSGDLMLRAIRQNGQIIISVKDNGPGIPEEAQIRLFEKFYRAKQPGQERIKGTGLGLAIVKTIAERHGGTARCHSKIGEGSTFYIELPSLPETNGKVD